MQMLNAYTLRRPLSSVLLALAGFILIGMGVYFVFVRPPLLPEDIRFMGTVPAEIQKTLPGLTNWLQKVFWVLGGYIFSTGLLTLYLSQTSFRHRARGAFGVTLIAGLSSIGLMTSVNFILDSDFKIVLLTFTLPWIAALILYRLHK
jgi:hypothetical protein